MQLREVYRGTFQDDCRGGLSRVGVWWKHSSAAVSAKTPLLRCDDCWATRAVKLWVYRLRVSPLTHHSRLAVFFRCVLKMGKNFHKKLYLLWSLRAIKGQKKHKSLQSFGWAKFSGQMMVIKLGNENLDKTQKNRVGFYFVCSHYDP